MKNHQRIQLCAWMCAGVLLAPHAPAGTADTNGLKTLVAGNTAFACGLYGRLKGAEGNLFFSPYSISTCLGMTYAGARGQTEEQMARVLHFGTNQAEVPAPFGSLQEQLNAVQQKKQVALNVANGLWAQAGHPFLPDFLDTVRQHYRGKVNQADFRTAAEATRKVINDWVSDSTSNRITDLFAPGKLDAATRLVLVNAIYFKGAWAQPFKETGTTDSTFTISAGQRVKARLMNITANFNYAEVPGLQVLELPYAGGDLSMVVLLPADPNVFKMFESLLNASTLKLWLGPLRERKVNVFLPKFKLTSQFELAPTLRSMGMGDAFSPAADFSGIDGARDLFISDVVHKAFVEVNEEGTEAAAATGAAMKSLAVRPEPIPVFRADHSFIFLIRDTQTESVLFLGRVVDPTK